MWRRLMLLLTRRSLLLLVALICLSCGRLLAAEVAPATQATAPQAAAGVTIVAPEAGLTATVGDVLDVLLVVQEGLDISSVAALCDARGIGLAQAPPYAFKWDTKGLEAGSYV